jgi:hypothetical protein
MDMVKNLWGWAWGPVRRLLNRPDGTARLAIILLALSACWGVFDYGALFVPWPFALFGAAAFECGYIGLASLDLSGDRQKRAKHIALTAVGCSIVFNSISGLEHFQPGLVHSLPLRGQGILAVVHATPLSYLSYQLADLLIHHTPVTAPQEHEAAATVRLLPAQTGSPERRYPCPSCQEPLNLGEYGSACRRGYCLHCKEKVLAAR